MADQLVETIEKAGIKRIYAVTGDSLNEVNDAVRRRGTVEWVHVRHEEAGAYAAAAEAELNGIACCAGSSGPGHVHLVNGLYDANRNNVSVFAIASTCASSEFGTDYFQETDTTKLFADCSGYNQLPVTPVQFSRMIQAALQHTLQKKEVAVLCLPGDLAAQRAVESPTAAFALPTRGVYRPQDSELQRLADMIDSSERITIYCGIGARDAHDEVVKLAETIKAPVGYSFKAKMAIQHHNPYEIGMTGLLGLPSAFAAMHAADLLILLGTDFPYESFMPEQCKIVQVDCRPERIGRRAKVDLALGGNVKDTLQALLPLLRTRTDDDFLLEQLQIYEKVREDMASVAEKKGGNCTIAPEYVTSLIDKLAAEDAIFTVDTGMCCVWGARFLNATGKREMLGSFNHGSMANAMPMAIGAAFARPQQQVVALCGDGGISMLLGDLVTIVQYKLPVKLIVFDNRALGMVKLEMEVAGLPDWQTDMYNPDFAAVAEAMGMKGYSVSDPAELEEVLKQALAFEGPVLVRVCTDPNALAMPPKVEFSQIKGFGVAMARMILTGRGDEVWETAKSNIKNIWGIL